MAEVTRLAAWVLVLTLSRGEAPRPAPLAVPLVPDLVLRHPEAATTAIAPSLFLDGGRTLVCIAPAEAVFIWDTRTGKLKARLPGEWSHHLACSPDGKVFATGGDGGVIQLWDTTTWKRTGVLEGHKDGVTSIRFAPDGRSLVSAARDGTVRIWDLEKKETRFRFVESKGGNYWVRFDVSPDGKLLATTTD